MGPQAKTEYLTRTRDRYLGTTRRAQKSQWLAEAVSVTGYHRKAVLRFWHRYVPEGPARRRRGRPCRYGPAVRRALQVLWEVTGSPWSVRLKALLPLWLPWARKRLSLTPAAETALAAISPRQIDRLLAPVKREHRKRLYGRTKPGTLLKQQIPVKTDHWDVHEPGFTEVDLVSHSGECADGEFAQSLDMTDIHTTWVETRALLGKSQERVCAALAVLRDQLPFALRGIDSDNGSEFINFHLHAYCDAAGIQFTRGRPYKKDDNAHVEQKNWTHVRKRLGYLRYDTAAAVDAMNVVYADLRLLQNLFLPSVKLQGKMRVGARLRRRYDAPQTPLDRVRACPSADPEKLAALLALRATLDPFALATAVERKLERVYALATVRRAAPFSPVGGGVAIAQIAMATPPPKPKPPRPFR